MDDAALVERIAMGDETAFAAAYDRNASFVFGSAARFLGDREAAAEVVQDTFMALWGRADQFDRGAGSLLSWLLGIARNRAIDRMRAEGRRPMQSSVPLDALTAGASDRDAGEPGASGHGRLVTAEPEDEPAAVAQRRWLQSVIRTGVSELPDEERQVLLLAYSGGLSQSEIAGVLDWPLGTVKSRTRRAMAHLRLRLARTPGVLEP